MIYWHVFVKKKVFQQTRLLKKKPTKKQFYRINEATEDKGQGEHYAITLERRSTLKELVLQIYLFISFKEAI